MTPLESAVGPESSCRVCGGTLATNPDTSNIRDWEYGVEGEWSYRRCNSCSVRQIDPFPTLDDLKRAYDIDYHGYAVAASGTGLYGMLQQLARKALIRKLRPIVRPGSRVLDVGCGSGAFLANLEELQPAERTGIDFSDTAIELTRAKGIEQTYRGVFTEFPAEQGSYDVIFMNNYLEHTLSPFDEAARACELLRPGGMLVGEVPNFDSLDRVVAGRYWGGNHVPRHTFQFNRAALEDVFARAGFSRTDFSYPLSTAHIALSVQNYLQRNVPDLRDNPALTRGRAGYFGLLLLLGLPLNLPLVLTGKAGLIDFVATKAEA